MVSSPLLDGAGLRITSASVKKGKPTVVKYSWKYNHKSPRHFGVAVVEMWGHEFTLLDDDVRTRRHGGDGKGKYTASIESRKDTPSDYALVFVDINNRYNVYATSETFKIKRSDFE
ncbi:hypothetical protein M407DRAFT_28563 [Tulasnella calospora MUT 4182]|uniref:Uncharacterized protein n=1 Tax=Tulasnella calospora MUT 4182 TaxID=1051891 RepID=A0A0C3QAH5_9AGAM|nr:hypothetical protein M407DRAFT_28563 [Tulasnella calospora MUT 4182]